MEERIGALGGGGQERSRRKPKFDPEAIAKQVDSVPMTRLDGTPMTLEEIADAFATESLFSSPDLLGS